MISTVHRAKGLEWKRVKVANDFRLRGTYGSRMPDEDELRLLDVAVTRAQHVLDIAALRDVAYTVPSGRSGRSSDSI